MRPACIHSNAPMLRNSRLAATKMTVNAPMFFGRRPGAASQVLLHHVLVQSRHGDRHEHPCQDVLEPMVARPPIVGHPNPGHAGVRQGRRQVQPALSTSVQDASYGHDHRQQHASRLKGVRPNHSAHAAPAGVGVYDRQDGGGGACKPPTRDLSSGQRFQHEDLEDQGHEKQPERRADHPAQQKNADPVLRASVPKRVPKKL